MSDTSTPTAEPTTDTQPAPPAEPEKGEIVKDAGQKPEPKQVPEAALAASRDKVRGLEKELEGFREKQKATDDAQAKAAGNVEAVQLQRDEFGAELKEWHAGAKTKLEKLLTALDEDADARGLYDDLVDDDTPLPKRLAAAERIAARTNDQTTAAYGGGAAKTKSDPASVMPSTVHDRDSYEEYLAKVSLSPDEKINIYLNPDLRQRVEAEALERGWR